ncbi:MAG: polysaccharide pyruvyl transferase family protein [Candidatus Electrothrix sp. AR1]|nr:polysaccharide pyruvyl transferase family protein [Candidatus Electrothrix sp. AR1]
MKIALVTIHKSYNYGAVLQAYATNKILSRFGEVKTVDYESRYLSKQLNYFRFSPSVHGGMMLIHDVLRFPYRYNLLYKFKKFIQTHMNLTEELSSDEVMQNKAGDFDIYVCGSDQIWNPRIVRQIDPVFFLTFAPKGAKKISLSSSIGSYIFSDKEKKKLVGMLEDFDAVSLREDDGQKQLSGILPNKKIHHVLDPTLLFSKDEWLDFMDLIQVRSRKKYLLVYTVPRAKLMKEAVNFFSKKFGLQVVLIDQGLFSSITSEIILEMPVREILYNFS